MSLREAREGRQTGQGVRQEIYHARGQHCVGHSGGPSVRRESCVVVGGWGPGVAWLGSPRLLRGPDSAVVGIDAGGVKVEAENVRGPSVFADVLPFFFSREQLLSCNLRDAGSAPPSGLLGLRLVSRPSAPDPLQPSSWVHAMLEAAWAGSSVVVRLAPARAVSSTGGFGASWSELSAQPEPQVSAYVTSGCKHSPHPSESEDIIGSEINRIFNEARGSVLCSSATDDLPQCVRASLPGAVFSSERASGSSSR